MKNSKLTLESMSQAAWYNRWTLNKFKKYLNGEILEVGCGIGNFTKSLVNYGKVFAIDIDKDYVKATSKLVKEKDRVGLGNIETGIYFFNGKQFDSIVCVNVLEHIQNEEGALKNLYDLLKNGGFLILLVPSHHALYGKIDESIGHFRRYDRQHLVNKLRKLGFNIKFCRRLNFLGGLGWWISGKILGENTVTEGKIRAFNLLAPIILPLEDIIEPPLGTSILVIANKKE